MPAPLPNTPILTLTPPFTDWKTELAYCFLSASSKLFLGLLLYTNILVFASFDEGLNDSVATNAIGN
jgi:hypothetical protein